jgi:predicted PurR-regulated permease PerM
VIWIEQHAQIDIPGLREALNSLPGRASQWLLGLATIIVTGFAGFVGQALVMLFVLFFVFRDGDAAVDRIASLLPLERDRTDLLLSRMRESIFANVYGIFAVGIAQGMLTAVALVALGVGSALLLGIIAAVCSVVPLVGPSLVWLPVSISFFFSGNWIKGLVLIAWGLVVVGMADNIIRPLVVAGRVQLHPAVLLFALLGGVQQFGFVGLFIGPIGIALILSVIEMLREETVRTSEKPPAPGT